MINIGVFKKRLDRDFKKLKVVSFDVFDTLLIRLLPSECVSKLSAEKLSRLIFHETLIVLPTDKIFNSRIKFRPHRNTTGSRNEEWTLSQWLTALAEKQGIDPELMNRWGRQAELQSEFLNLRLDHYAIEALNEAKERELMVIATSDMWLDQDWLEDLLKDFQLFFDKVFTSGSLGASKRKGTIFKVIENQLALYPGTFLHVGNKFRSDYLQPRMAGWNSLLTYENHPLMRMNLPTKIRKGPFRPKPLEKIFQALDADPPPKISNPYYYLAYEFLSFLLIIFSVVQWRRFRAQHIDAALFIARDARIMLDVYDSISDLLPGGYPRHYIRLSRKAIALAHPNDLLQNVIPLAGKIGRKNVGQWLSNFAVSQELYEQVLNRSGLTHSSDFGASERLSLRKACRSLQKEITAEQHLQKKLIRDYISQQMGGRIPKRVGIVDTGWACTTQDTIRSLLDEAEFLSGIYFGVSRQGQFPEKRNLKYGLLRDDFRRAPHHNPVEASAGAVRMWDTLLREPAGSVLRLERKGTGEVIPKQEPMREIGTAELTAADMIRTGIREGLEARRKGVAGLVAIADQIADRDFEIAATAIARNISTRPNRKIAAAIIRMGFDEGSASGKAGTIGLNGLIDGVAWYSGILSSIGLRWTAPFLELFARMALRYKRKSISSRPCGKTIN